MADEQSVLQTLVAAREETVKIRRSTFIGYCAPVLTVEAAKLEIAERSNLHRRATHNCWAYVVGTHGETSHASDAGEPTGTAGRPMLNALKAAAVTNVVTVVTRYYGGVKLGVRGLIDAYGETVTTTIAAGKLVDVVERERYEIVVPYPLVDRVIHRLDALGGEQQQSDYGELVTLVFELPQRVHDEVAAYLTQLSGEAQVRHRRLD